MRDLINLVEGTDDEIHKEVHKKTGFWGAQGAGCVIFSLKTKRFLIAHRGPEVQEPDTWGTWGGAIDRGENPIDAVKREVAEEAGYHEEILKIIPLYVFNSGSFRYSNFVAVIGHEFTPSLDWENQGYEWAELGNFPTPIHFGLKAVLDDPKSMKILEMLAKPSE